MKLYIFKSFDRNLVVGKRLIIKVGKYLLHYDTDLKNKKTDRYLTFILIIMIHFSVHL